MTKQPFEPHRVGDSSGSRFWVRSTPHEGGLPPVMLTLEVPGAGSIEASGSFASWLTVEQAIELRDALDAAVRAVTEQEETL